MVIPAFVSNILSRLEDCGFEAYIVGGCVRDSLLEKEPFDWDITTSAKPEEAIAALSDFRIIPTGIKHGTITVISHGNSVEVTTYRVDGSYMDNRHPKSVCFTLDLAEDLSRRDFTVNALAYNPSSGLVDIYGGLEDLNNRVIRCVGEPNLRFKEDALRILRGLRFASTLCCEIEQSTKLAAVKCSKLLKRISAERIFAEFTKILLAPDPSLILTDFYDIFASILNVESGCFKTRWDKNCMVLGSLPSSLPLRLAVLMYGIGQEKLSLCLSSLKCSKAVRQKTELLSYQLEQKLSLDRLSIKYKLSEVDAENFNLVLLGKLALGIIPKEDFSSALCTLKQILDENPCLTIAKLAIDGFDLKKALGFNGRKIGEVLRLLLDAVIEERCQNNKESLLEYATLFLNQL